MDEALAIKTQLSPLPTHFLEILFWEKKKREKKQHQPQ